MRRIRILLADDHTMICAGFQKLLEPQYEVVGNVGDGRALLKAAVELKPDVVLVDVGMPLLNGLDAGRELKKIMPGVKLVFLTMNADVDVAGEAFKVGASAYLLKNAPAAELLRAVHDVFRGKVVCRAANQPGY
jgi:DNA-binding NarL/FixJ family response regulator